MLDNEILKNNDPKTFEFKDLYDIRNDVFKFIDEIYTKGLITEENFLKAFQFVFELSDEKIKEIFNGDGDEIQEVQKAVSIINNGREGRDVCKTLAIIGMSFLKRRGLSVELFNKKDEEAKLKRDDWHLRTEFGDFSPYYDRVAFGDLGYIPKNTN